MSAAGRAPEARPRPPLDIKNAGGSPAFVVCAEAMPEQEPWHQPHVSVEQRVDVVLRGMAGVAVQLRAVLQLVVAFAGVDDRRRMRLDSVDVVPDFYHLEDVLLDELHGRHHFADALTGEVLEVTGLED